MNMTLDVSWQRVFVPAPFSEGSGKEFELPARGREATPNFAMDAYANQSTTFPISIRTRDRHHIWRSRFRGASEHAKPASPNVVPIPSPDGDGEGRRLVGVSVD